MSGEDMDRRKNDPWLDEIGERIAVLEERIDEIKANTDEIVLFFKNGKGFFAVASGVGTFAKWIATIGAGVVIVWGVIEYGIAQAIKDARGK